MHDRIEIKAYSFLISKFMFIFLSCMDIYGRQHRTCACAECHRNIVFFCQSSVECHNADKLNT